MKLPIILDGRALVIISVLNKFGISGEMIQGAFSSVNQLIEEIPSIVRGLKQFINSTDARLTGIEDSLQRIESLTMENHRRIIEGRDFSGECIDLAELCAREEKEEFKPRFTGQTQPDQRHEIEAQCP